MRSIELPDGRELSISEWQPSEAGDRGQNDAGAVCWDAALVLCAYIGLQAPLVVSRRVIELGCGPGAVGLTAAALGAAAVTLTDLPHLLPLVQQNIEANGLGATAAAAPLEWGTSVGHLSPPCDLVLASDVLYQAEALPLFVQTLAALSGPRTLALLCNERRAPLPFPRALFEGAGFSVAAVPLKEQHPEWRSEDIELFRISRAPADS